MCNTGNAPDTKDAWNYKLLSMFIIIYRQEGEAGNRNTSFTVKRRKRDWTGTVTYNENRATHIFV